MPYDVCHSCVARSVHIYIIRYTGTASEREHNTYMRYQSEPSPLHEQEHKHEYERSAGNAHENAAKTLTRIFEATEAASRSEAAELTVCVCVWCTVNQGNLY